MILNGWMSECVSEKVCDDDASLRDKLLWRIRREQVGEEGSEGDGEGDSCQA